MACTDGLQSIQTKRLHASHNYKLGSIALTLGYQEEDGGRRIRELVVVLQSLCFAWWFNKGRKEGRRNGCWNHQAKHNQVVEVVEVIMVMGDAETNTFSSFSLCEWSHCVFTISAKFRKWDDEWKVRLLFVVHRNEDDAVGGAFSVVLTLCPIFTSNRQFFSGKKSRGQIGNILGTSATKRTSIRHKQNKRNHLPSWKCQICPEFIIVCWVCSASGECWCSSLRSGDPGEVILDHLTSRTGTGS